MAIDIEKLSACLDTRNRIPTQNAMGFMFLTQNRVRQALMAYAHSQYTIADVGCAYGFDTMALVEGGAKVTAIDLDEVHLTSLSKQLTDNQRKQVTLKKAHFPHDNPLEENTYDAILLSRILIFLRPHDINSAFIQAYKALKPGGKLFIVNATPFSHRWEILGDLYKSHQAQSPHHPFFVEDIWHFLPFLKPYFPSHLMLFDEFSLLSCLTDHNFTVLESGYEEEEGTTDVFSIAIRP